ncbi:MAG: branched-chain amino acid aminotransferase [Lachnospirales bacterium]
MEKQNIDWANIGFAYTATDMRFVSNYKDGKWEDVGLTSDPAVVINECAGILQYCQQVFEGLKAFETADGSIVTFRPDLNAERLMDSAKPLQIPPYPKEKFLAALDEVIKANASWVPPYGSGASLYIRPYIFATGPVIGIKPADEYQFRIICMPVGPYYRDGIKPLTLCVSDFDRSAPNGTGNIKAGLNYAMSLNANIIAHKNGYDENMYLDPATKTYIEESGGANFIFVTKDNEIVTPKSSSILPSITRRSILYIAENIMGLKVTERPILLSELENFSECAMCGTAAVLSPVGKVVDHGKEIAFPSGMTNMGKVTQELYNTLIGIQKGTVEAPEGWIRKIM